MRDHIPTIALVIALAMVLGALVLLSLHGKSESDPVLIGLVGAVGTVVGVIGGFSQNKQGAPTQPPGTLVQKETRTKIETPGEPIA